jgi:hypothetical protein
VEKRIVKRKFLAIVTNLYQALKDYLDYRHVSYEIETYLYESFLNATIAFQTYRPESQDMGILALLHSKEYHKALDQLKELQSALKEELEVL